MCTALTATAKLISPDLLTAVLAPVLKLLDHPQPAVRKKAVMALHRFEQLDPTHDGPLSGAELDTHFRRMLCDKVRRRRRPIVVSYLRICCDLPDLCQGHNVARLENRCLSYVFLCTPCHTAALLKASHR